MSSQKYVVLAQHTKGKQKIWWETSSSETWREGKRYLTFNNAEVTILKLIPIGVEWITEQ